MKGISLSIQTVVIFILAAAVVVILLMFFISGSSETMDTITAKGRQARLCITYATNQECQGTASPELERVCAALKDEYPLCTSATPECIQQCCKTYCEGAEALPDCESLSRHSCLPRDYAGDDCSGASLYNVPGDGQCEDPDDVCCKLP